MLHCFGPTWPFISRPRVSKYFFCWKFSAPETTSQDLIKNLQNVVQISSRVGCPTMLGCSRVCPRRDNCLFTCKATKDNEETNNIQTIPWVTNAPDYFQGYGAKAIGAVCILSASAVFIANDQCSKMQPQPTGSTVSRTKRPATDSLQI